MFDFRMLTLDRYKLNISQSIIFISDAIENDWMEWSTIVSLGQKRKKVDI